MANSPMTLETIRAIAARFPGMEKGLVFGSPCFKVRDKFVAGFARFEGTFCFKVDDQQRAILLQAEPQKYFITDHYKPVLKNGATYIVARLDKLDAVDVAVLLEAGYLLTAAKKQVKAFRAAQKPSSSSPS